MKAISKINNTLAKIEGAVMVFWFAIVLVVMNRQVVSRYISLAPDCVERRIRALFLRLDQLHRLRVLRFGGRAHRASPRFATRCRPRPRS